MTRTKIRSVLCLVIVTATAQVSAGLISAPAQSAPAAVAAATTGPQPCIQPLVPTTILDTAKAPGALVTGKPRTVTLPASVPAGAAAVVLQVRTKSAKTGAVTANAVGSTGAATVIANVGTKWLSGTEMVVAPTQQLSVAFVGPASSNTQATIQLVGFAAAQNCFNPLPFHAAVDSVTGAGLAAAGALPAGTTRSISLQGASFLPPGTGAAFASVSISAGATLATTVTLKDDSDPANTLAAWTVAAKGSVRNLEMLPPSSTHNYSLTVTGGPASVSISPQGWFTGPDAYSGSSDVVLDSAGGVGAAKGALLLGRLLTFKVPADIPSSAAVLVSLTATSPNQDSTLSVWTGGLTRPAVVSLNLSKHQAFRQQVLVAPGTSNSFSIREDSGSTSLKATVVGWIPFPTPVNTPVDGVTHVAEASQVAAAQPDPDNGALTIVYSGDHIDVGDVMVSDATDLLPDGYIGVVTDINPSTSPAARAEFGAMATMAPPSSEVTLQQGSLLDALPTADMDSATLDVSSADPTPDDLPPLGPDDPTGVDPSIPDPTPSAMAKSQAVAASQTGGQVPGGRTFCSGSAGGFKVSTPLKLSGGANLSGSWRPGSTKVAFTFDGSLTGSLAIGANAGIICGGDVTIQGPSLPTLRFTVGPIPVVVRPVLSLKLGLHANVGGAFQVKTAVDVGTSAGISYDNGSWSPTFSTHANFPTTVDARVGGSAEVTVAPRLTLMLYGVVGPYIELAGDAKASANLVHQPWWTASVDLSAKAGLVLDAWFLHANFDASRSLYHGSWSATSPYPGPVVTTLGLPNGQVSVPYSKALQSSGGTGPITWSVVGGSLPPNLHLSSNGVVSGTPSTQGNWNVTVRAMGANGYRNTKDQSLGITIGAQPTDNCPGGDFSGSPYDGTCGSAPVDNCPGGDYSGNPYDGDCGTAPGGGGGSISLSRGAAAPAGYWYSVALSGFAPGSVVSVTCRDSVSPGGFYNQNFTMNGAGQASSAKLCYSADHPDHWVTSSSGVASNHVGW